MTKISVTHEFDCPEEREQLDRLMSSSKYFDILYDVDQKLREKLKYGEDEWLTDEAHDYLQNIRDEMWETGIFNER